MELDELKSPKAYPQWYVGDFSAKYNFIRASSLAGCSGGGCMLRFSWRDKTAEGITPPGKTCEPSAAICNGAVLNSAIGS